MGVRIEMKQKKGQGSASHEGKKTKVRSETCQTTQKQGTGHKYAIKYYQWEKRKRNLGAKLKILFWNSSEG